MGALTVMLSMVDPPQFVTVTENVPVVITEIVSVVPPVDQSILPPAFDVTINIDVSPVHISLTVEDRDIIGAELGAETIFES